MSNFRFAIDRGGTFTDVYAEYKTKQGVQECTVLKLLSVDTGNYEDAPREAIRRILETITGDAYPKEQPIDTSKIDWIRMGTTVATNALLERKGERTAFATTAGFRHLLTIGNQARPKIFDLRCDRPGSLYEEVVEVQERVRPLFSLNSRPKKEEATTGKNKDGKKGKEGKKAAAETKGEREALSEAEAAGLTSEEIANGAYKVAGVTGDMLLVVKKLDEKQCRRDLQAVFERGITSLAVGLVHSFNFPQHELRVAAIAKEIGFTHVSCSSQLMPMVKLIPRSFTANADAYLTPTIQIYLTNFCAGFDSSFLQRVKLSFMQSDGGLAAIDKFSGFKAVLSGPAGGVVGYAKTTASCLREFLTEDGRSIKNSGDLAAFASASVKTTPEVKSPKGGKRKAADMEPAPGEEEEAEGEGRGAEEKGEKKERLQVIGFDMGGTSTDVSRYSGSYQHVFENVTAGVLIQAPQLDINTVAAGGGSILFFRSGLFVVGPESAGAQPGPFCYRKGGPLTVTDANLFLGRLMPERFPAIFGPNHDQQLDAEGTRAAFQKLTNEINEYFAALPKPVNSLGVSVPVKKFSAEQVAFGFLEVANESMCRPIRALTQAHGYDITQHVLACFGGAGGQHACAIARSLGIAHVFVHRYSGILSAYGMGLAQVVEEVQQPCRLNLSKGGEQVWNKLQALMQELTEKAVGLLGEQGFSRESMVLTPYLNLRYEGTDTAFFITASPSRSVFSTENKKGKKSPKAAVTTTASTTAGDLCAYDFEQGFLKRVQREFGFTLERPVLVDDVRIRAEGRFKALGEEHRPVMHQLGAPIGGPLAATADAEKMTPTKQVYWSVSGGFVPTAVVEHSSLTPGQVLTGPLLILDRNATVLVEPKTVAKVTKQGHLLLCLDPVASTANSAAASSTDVPMTTTATATAITTKAVVAVPALATGAAKSIVCNSILLSIFAQRFMSIAEQMGHTLQRTAISTNIKERLDFSCALFGPDGGLVANAPHLPVHLGAMQEAVRFQIQYRGASWLEGDVIMSNHPQAGGSHLPDITVITPVFDSNKDDKGKKRAPVFFVASRGHHGDIGGISPGSMPPFSKYLREEGAAVKSLVLVHNAQFKQREVTSFLTNTDACPSDPERTARIGTRNLSDNLSDLKAKVAANHRGIQLVAGLIKQYSLPVVQAYMGFIQANAELAVREMLKTIAQQQTSSSPCSSSSEAVDPLLCQTVELSAEDHMDDGTLIALSVKIDPSSGSAVFDFTGTGPQVYGNTNAPPAVTYSAIIYCLRCMVDRDIPLNQGCLTPIKVVIPPGCLLNPHEELGVVGGNVLTSQRVTDVVLKAFQACAASQGCMNNFTFGNERFGYYETIAGGAGAGPTWQGTSGIHTHMTNTRITDVEILEQRYPVMVDTFTLRDDQSGGIGKFSGGEGVIRTIRALEPLSFGILSERRSYQPYGMAGGGPGKCGQNLIYRPFSSATTLFLSDPAITTTSTLCEAPTSAVLSPTPSAGLLMSMGAKNTIAARVGDRIIIKSPGGGGYGVPLASSGAAQKQGKGVEGRSSVEVVEDGGPSTRAGRGSAGSAGMYSASQLSC